MRASEKSEGIRQAEQVGRVWGHAGERVDIMTGSGGKVLSAFVEEVSPMRTHLRDDHWRPYVIPNKVKCSY